jgi:hypothetical protein
MAARLMKIRLIAIGFALALFGCSSRSEKEIREENSTKIKIDHLYAQIEQSLFDAARAKSNWSLNATLQNITDDSKARSFLHVESTPDYFFAINPNESLWLQQTNAPHEVAIYSPQPFHFGKLTQYVVIHFSGDASLTNSLPTWQPVSLPSW